MSVEKGHERENTFAGSPGKEKVYRWCKLGCQGLLATASVAFNGETLERGAPLHAFCHHPLCGEGDGATNKRQLHCAAKPILCWSRAEDEKWSVCNPWKDSLFPAFSVSLSKSVPCKGILHTVWLPDNFSHHFSTIATKSAKCFIGPLRDSST